MGSSCAFNDDQTNKPLVNKKLSLSFKARKQTLTVHFFTVTVVDIPEINLPWNLLSLLQICLLLLSLLRLSLPTLSHLLTHHLYSVDLLSLLLRSLPLPFLLRRSVDQVGSVVLWQLAYSIILPNLPLLYALITLTHLLFLGLLLNFLLPPLTFPPLLSLLFAHLLR